MATKVKGFLKGFKHLSQIFVVKEQEMEIGYPRDVKHVAHIGRDSGSTCAPSWMNEFASSDFSSSLCKFGQSREASWASQEFDQPKGLQKCLRAREEGAAQPDVPRAPKKARRRKQKASSRSSRRSSKSKASYATAIGDDSEAQDQLRGV